MGTQVANYMLQSTHVMMSFPDRIEHISLLQTLPSQSFCLWS